MADSNYTQLKIETGRLEEHRKKSSWWMVLLLLFILLVFVNMVVFMKLFPKPSPWKASYEHRLCYSILTVVLLTISWVCGEGKIHFCLSVVKVDKFE